MACCELNSSRKKASGSSCQDSSYEGGWSVVLGRGAGLGSGVGRRGIVGEPIGVHLMSSIGVRGESGRGERVGVVGGSSLISVSLTFSPGVVVPVENH